MARASVLEAHCAFSGNAVGVLMPWLWSVECEVEGFEEGRNTMRRMQLLRGAVMAAGIEAVEAGRGGW